MTDGMDFSSLLAQAQEMQSKMVEAQQAQAEMSLQGSAASGKVLVEVNGVGEFQNVVIDPELVASEDASMLSDLVLTAIKDATSKVAEVQAEALGEIGLPDGLPGA